MSELHGRTSELQRSQKFRGFTVEVRSVRVPKPGPPEFECGVFAPVLQNFYRQTFFYEIDGEEVGSVLRADEYGGDEDFSWVLLEPAEGA